MASSGWLFPTHCVVRLGHGMKIVISHIADDFRQAYGPRMHTDATPTATAIATPIQIRIREPDDVGRSTEIKFAPFANDNGASNNGELQSFDFTRSSDLRIFMKSF